MQFEKRHKMPNHRYAHDMMRWMFIPLACFGLAFCSSENTEGVNQRIRTNLDAMNRLLADPTTPLSRRPALTNIRNGLMEHDIASIITGHSVAVYASYLIHGDKLIIEAHWLSDKPRISSIKITENGAMIYQQALPPDEIAENLRIQPRAVVFDCEIVIEKESMFRKVRELDSAHIWKLEFLNQQGVVATEINMHRSPELGR